VGLPTGSKRGAGGLRIHYIWAVTNGPAHKLPFDFSHGESEIVRRLFPEFGTAAPGDATEIDGLLRIPPYASRMNWVCPSRSPRRAG